MKLKNKKVLVTGASGFIGSHLTERLVELGAEVSVLVNKDTKIIDEKVKFLKKDILDLNETDLEKIEIIFHLAAITDLGACMKDPEKAYNINVLGTIRLLTKCKKLEKFVYISTLGVYGNPVKLPASEDDLTLPIEPYAASKLAAENFVFSYCSNNSIDFSIARLFNVYGPRQDPKFIISKIVKSSLDNEQLELKNLDATRDFIYIADVIDALLKIAENGKNEIYNVGTGIETPISEVLKIMEMLLNKKIHFKVVENDFRLGVSRSKADTKKIKSHLGWKFKISLKEGIKKTYEYYKHDL